MAAKEAAAKVKPAHTGRHRRRSRRRRGAGARRGRAKRRRGTAAGEPARRRRRERASGGQTVTADTKLQRCTSAANTADGFTKTLTGPAFLRSRAQMLGHDAPQALA
jgi:hypothetical protein